jgi:hypothetical protein
MRLFLMGWAVLTLAGLLQPSAKPALSIPTTFTVGVLRRDALIVPFATYDGKNWKNYWPAPREGADVPISLRSVNKGWWGAVGPRDMWQVWTLDASPQIVKVRQPDWVSSYCHKVVGLRTDYQPRFRPPPPGVNPYPKDGLAVSPPHPVEPIEVIGADSPERDDVVEAIHAPFAEREDEVLASLRDAHNRNPQTFGLAPNAKELRAMPPLVLEALYAYGTSRRTYFIEGAREYKRDGVCSAIVFVRGMVARESGKFSTDGIRLGVSSCDRATATYMLPFGVMSLPTGVYWIAQISGWSRESYSIIDITRRSKAADRSAPGGGC